MSIYNPIRYPFFRRAHKPAVGLLMMMMMRLGPRMLHLMGDCHKQLRVFRHKNLLLTKPHDTQAWAEGRKAEKGGLGYMYILLKSWPGW